MDMSGVSLAAIKRLNQERQAQEAKIRALEERLARLEALLESKAGR